MDMKLIAALACGVALALGACSGGAPATSTTPSTPGPAEPGTGPAEPGTDPAEPGTPDPDTQTQAEKFDADLTKAQADLAAARMDVTSAKALADAAETAAERTAATKALSDARKGLADAAAAMKALTPPSGDANRRGRAIAAASAADAALAADTPKLTAGEARLVNTFAWFARQSLARYTLGNSEAVMPGEGSRDGAKVRINRIDRTIPSPTDANTQIANPKAFTGSIFKDHMYSDGKTVFPNSGDEFKVDGYAGALASNYTIDPYVLTGLKLTEAGLVISTGGAHPRGLMDSPQTRVDFTDMRKRVTDTVNTGTLPGQNGWDLELAFGEPDTISVPVGDPDRNLRSDWRGNGAFHWRSFVPADDSQLETDGDYYVSSTFGQPEGFKDLGTYEVWLSNYVGVDTKLEPLAGTTATCPNGMRGTSCPDDDEPYYLKYAAYGLFVYTVDNQATVSSDWINRVNSIHFGYSAFDAADGKKTTDIGEAITSGKFHGHTIAYASQGGINGTINKKLLRGDVTLTVNIPKGTGAGTLEGTMSNFQSWDDAENWIDYCGHPACTGSNGIEVTLNRVNISEDGTFIGETQVSPNNAFATNPAEVFSSHRGLFKGSFYGPRTDGSDLEVAGSFTVGKTYNWFDTVAFGMERPNPVGAGGRHIPNIFIPGTLSASHIELVGSFGAKQTPTATPASN